MLSGAKRPVAAAEDKEGQASLGGTAAPNRWCQDAAGPRGVLAQLAASVGVTFSPAS